MRGAAPFHAFLSYTNQDQAAAQALEALLRARGLRVWVDWRDLPAGERCDTIAWVIGQVPVVIILVGASEMGYWQKKEMYCAFSEERRRGVVIVPVLAVEAPPSASVPWLEGYSWVDLRQPGRRQLRRLVDAIRDALKEQPAAK